MAVIVGYEIQGCCVSYLFRGFGAPRRSLVLDVNGDRVIRVGSAAAPVLLDRRLGAAVLEAIA